jgi:hypothetical protein
LPMGTVIETTEEHALELVIRRLGEYTLEPVTPRGEPAEETKRKGLVKWV